VSDCGGIPRASAQLHLPDIFIHEILRSKPVPGYVLERIENVVGPIRQTKHSNRRFSKDALPDKNFLLQETEGESEITFQEFIRDCGGLLAASRIAKARVPHLLSRIAFHLSAARLERMRGEDSAMATVAW
jgi:hypothetical protein